VPRLSFDAGRVRGPRRKEEQMHPFVTLTAAAAAATLVLAGAAGAARAVIPAGESKALRSPVTTPLPFRYGYGAGVAYHAPNGSTVTLPGGVTVPWSWLG
jgi:hypothetical protein